MNSPTKLLITFICAILFISVQCKHSKSKHSDKSFDKSLMKFHVTLPEAGQYTQEYKIKMKKHQELKFTFTHPETYASCHFDDKTHEVFAVKHDQIVESKGKHTLVFKLYNKNPENAGKPETLTIMGPKGHHLSKKDFMEHKEYLLIPLYVGMAFTGIASAAIMVIAVMCVARIMWRGSGKTVRKTAHLPVYSSFAESVQPHNVQPAVYSQQPIYPSSSHAYPAHYYVHSEKSPLISSMYPSMSGVGNIQSNKQ
mmetsp:Transcript_6002/g.22753  ORF Transcript_6002/g.22753 Transcript_6002/m.22753 type:complete len:254 (-) Transcript_6002:2141-2902(-)